MFHCEHILHDVEGLKWILNIMSIMRQDDAGGKLTLQKRWTTFAKAQLVCPQGNELPFNILHDIVQLPPLEGDSSEDITFYGIFSSQWSLFSVTQLVYDSVIIFRCKTDISHTHLDFWCRAKQTFTNQSFEK